MPSVGFEKTARTGGEAVVLGLAVLHDRHDAHAVEPAVGMIPARIGKQIGLMSHERPVNQVRRLPESDDILHAGTA